VTTLFSRIIDGELPGRFAWADGSCVAFATIAPISPGHLLVVPRDPVARFTAAPPQLLTHLMAVTATIGRAQESAWPGARAAVLIAGFEVPHLHVHVLPAWGEGELSFAAARSDTPAAELDESIERVRAALRAAGHGAQVPATLSSPAV
jgi:diadenosine tetraphosphate (Ap4A) HIT family hydrolase